MSRAVTYVKAKSEGLTAEREEESETPVTRATAVSRGGGDGPVETSSNADREASGEGDPLKKRKKSLGKRMRSFGRVSSSSIQSHGPGVSVRNPQASGGPVSLITGQMQMCSIGESRIRKLEEKLRNSEYTSSKLEEEVQHKEQEYQQALAELEKNHAAVLSEKIEAFRKSLQQQQVAKLEEGENQYKLEAERVLQQHKAELGNQERVLRAGYRKQLREKEEEISARGSETKKLLEELTQKEKLFNEEQQHLRNTQIKVTQTQESQLQRLRQELTEKDEEVQMKLGEKETQVQRFVQKADKQLQECQAQLQQEQERHAQEKKQMIEKQQRSLQEMADKLRQYEEQQQKDIPQQEADQITKGHEAQTEQLKLQHKIALEEKDRQLAESRSRLQEETQRYDKDITKRMRDFQAKLADAKRRHKTQLEDKQKQYEASLSDERKCQDNALELKVVQVRRSLEKESQRKEEETTLNVEHQIQQREQVLRQELQQRELVLQQELRQMTENFETQLREAIQQHVLAKETLSTRTAELSELRGEVGALRRENDDLKEEIEAQKTQDVLACYKIESFSKLEEGVSKGSGSFGSIHLIEVNGVPCIAKRLHDILVGRGRAEAVDKVQKHSIKEKFRRECVFLSRLRHPNIVQFMGVHYGQDPSDLTLIMECLPMDLEKCLKQYPNLPLSIKISILLDVSYGLLHLHSQMPPIIHRDLTAANILLTSDMKAKLADLGVSKILDLNPLHGASLTAGPGALAYMPPEAQQLVPVYDTKLDDFSFGVVALYVANQEFPMPEDRGTAEAFQKKETHIEKRRQWVDRVGKSHPLYELITSCLQDVPDKRPTTSQINATVKQLSKCHPRRFQDIMEMNQHLRCLEQNISASLSKLQSQASELKEIVKEV